MDPIVEIQARKLFGRYRWRALDDQGREIARSPRWGYRTVAGMGWALKLLFGPDVMVVMVDARTNPVAKRNTYERQWRKA